MVNKVIKSVLFFLCFGVISNHVAAYEKLLSVGVQNHSIQQRTGDPNIDDEDLDDSSFHIGFRLYNQINAKNLIGVGLDYDEVGSQKVLGYRAIDYRYLLSNRIHLGAFFGAASLDSGLPQNGYYYGFNASFLLIPEKLSLSFENKFGDGLARDRLLSTDPEDSSGENRPDIFLDYQAYVLALQWHF